jgi:hypothetical protein
VFHWDTHITATTAISPPARPSSCVPCRLLHPFIRLNGATLLQQPPLISVRAVCITRWSRPPSCLKGLQRPFNAASTASHRRRGTAYLSARSGLQQPDVCCREHLTQHPILCINHRIAVMREPFTNTRTAPCGSRCDGTCLYLCGTLVQHVPESWNTLLL